MRLRNLVVGAAQRDEYLMAGVWDDKTLAGQVRRYAEISPDRCAVVSQTGRYSYGTLAYDAARLAEGLEERGVDEGSVISVQLPNCYEFVVAVIVGVSLGAVVNPLLPDYRVRELGNVFKVAEPVVIISPAVYRGFDHRELVRAAGEASGKSPLHIVVGGDPGEHAVAFDSVLGEGGKLRVGRADLVSELIFTSGTEAQPKAIMHTEQTTNASARAAYQDLALATNDVVWMPSPLGHSTGLNCGLRVALFHGLSLVLQERWNADEALQLVSEERCTYTLVATTFLQDLVEAAVRQSVRLDSLRYFGCGGAPVPPALVDAAEDVGINVLRVYGSTEVLIASWNRPSSSRDKKRHSDGLPLSYVQFEIRDPEGRLLGPGQVGELYVRSPSASVGFFDDPERTAASFGPGGWVRSGDLLTMDEDGYVAVVGRKKEIIIRGGMNITPREIEELIGAFDEVDRVAIVGIPDDRLGEKMCACVIVKSGASLDLETTVARLRQAGLATYKLPQRIEVFDEFPSTASGKIQKYELVRIVSDRPEAEKALSSEIQPH